MRSTLVINLFGGASSGKSTTAMLIAGMLKNDGIKAEYVPESIKSMIWDDNSEMMDNQILITALHEHSVRRLIGKVDFIIMDSPIVSGAFYNKALGSGAPMSSELADRLFQKYDNINFLIPPREEYNSEGRFADEGGKIQEEIYQLSRSFIKGYGGVVMNEDFPEIPREQYAEFIVEYIKREFVK